MSNELITTIGEFIKRSLANNEQPWSCYVRMRIDTGKRSSYLTFNSEENENDYEEEEQH